MAIPDNREFKSEFFKEFFDNSKLCAALDSGSKDKIFNALQGKNTISHLYAMNKLAYLYNEQPEYRDKITDFCLHSDRDILQSCAVDFSKGNYFFSIDSFERLCNEEKKVIENLHRPFEYNPAKEKTVEQEDARHEIWEIDHDLLDLKIGLETHTNAQKGNISLEYVDGDLAVALAQAIAKKSYDRMDEDSCRFGMNELLRTTIGLLKSNNECIEEAMDIILTEGYLFSNKNADRSLMEECAWEIVKRANPVLIRELILESPQALTRDMVDYVVNLNLDNEIGVNDNILSAITKSYFGEKEDLESRLSPWVIEKIETSDDYDTIEAVTLKNYGDNGKRLEEYYFKNAENPSFDAEDRFWLIVNRSSTAEMINNYKADFAEEYKTIANNKGAMDELRAEIEGGIPVVGEKSEAKKAAMTELRDAMEEALKEKENEGREDI